FSFLCSLMFCFFFQAEDGIRDRNVTGVQTCALPISLITHSSPSFRAVVLSIFGSDPAPARGSVIENPVRISPCTSGRRYSSFWEIGRASCRERVEMAEGGAV